MFYLLICVDLLVGLPGCRCFDLLVMARTFHLVLLEAWVVFVGELVVCWVFFCFGLALRGEVVGVCYSVLLLLGFGFELLWVGGLYG